MNEKCYQMLCDVTKLNPASLFFFYFVKPTNGMNPAQTQTFENFPAQNLLEACKEESNYRYFLYGRGCVGL